MPQRKKGRVVKVDVPKPKKTYVALVIDRSSSMEVLQKEAVSAIKAQLQTLQKNAEKGGDTRVTLIMFDSDVSVYYDKVPATALEEFTDRHYRPYGWTAMFDGIGQAITCLETGIEETPDTAYLVITVSDGEENQSKKWSASALKQKIKHLEATGKWTFSYMLSNVDLEKYRGALNMFNGNSVSWTYTSTGLQNAASGMVASTVNYLNARSLGNTSTDNFYSSDTAIPVKNDKL